MTQKSRLDKLKDRLMENPEFRAEHEKSTPYAELAKAIIRLRIGEGLTQKQLAERIGTTQSAISRIETLEYGRVEFQTLEKIAQAFGKRLHVAFLEAS